MICNTFVHLSNTPQLSFLFVLKQNKTKGHLQGFGQELSKVSINSKIKLSGGDPSVIARASMKFLIIPNTTYECETSSKHKIF